MQLSAVLSCVPGSDKHGCTLSRGKPQETYTSYTSSDFVVDMCVMMEMLQVLAANSISWEAAGQNNCGIVLNQKTS